MNNYEAHRAPYRWVIVELDSTSDKKSLEHANAGYGYYIISKPQGRGSSYIAAYKLFGGKIERGQLATPEQADRLEKMDDSRYTWAVVEQRKRDEAIEYENRRQALQSKADYAVATGIFA